MRAAFWLRAAERTLAALALVVPLAFLLHSYDAASLKLTLLEAGALALAVAAALKGLERGRWEAPVALRPALVAAGAFALWAAARAAASLSPAAAIPALVERLLGAAVFCACALECGGARAVARFTTWLLAAAWVVGVYAAAQALGLDPLPWKGAFGGAAFATLGSPEGLGLFAAACAPLALARLADPDRGNPARAADAALLVLLACAAVATRSLGAALAAAAALAVAGAALPSYVPSADGRRAGVGGLLLAALVACAGIWGAAGRAGAPGHAQAAWSACGRLVAERPLTGFGPGGYALALDERRGEPALAALRPERSEGDSFRTRDERPERAPGQLAGVAVELGLPAAGLVLWLFGGVLYLAWRGRRRLVQRAALEESAQLAGLFGGLAGLFLACQWTPAAQELGAAWLLWPLAGLAAGLSALAARGPVAVLPIALTELSRRRLASGAALAAAALLVLPARWQAADVALNAATAAARAGAYAEAARLAQTADVWGARRQLEARYLAGSALLAAGRPTDALERLSSVEAQAPAFARLQYLKGRAELKLQLWELAQASFEKQRALDPRFVPALEGLAIAAKEAGRFDDARRAMLAAISLEPKDPVHYMALADIYRRERRGAEARELQQRAARLQKGQRVTPRVGRNGRNQG